jgi:hypothetical protein
MNKDKEWKRKCRNKKLKERRIDEGGKRQKEGTVLQ